LRGERQEGEFNGAGRRQGEQEKRKVKTRALETRKVAASDWPLRGFTGEGLCALESFLFNGLNRGELPV
jgi:hypothetical protein